MLFKSCFIKEGEKQNHFKYECFMNKEFFKKLMSIHFPIELHKARVVHVKYNYQQFKPHFPLENK